MLLSVAEYLTRVSDGKSEQLTTTMTFGERAAYCLERTLIGLVIIFGVLATIWLVLSIFKLIFYKDPAKQKKAEPTQAEKAPEPESVQTDDGEIVAAIIAAISAQRAAEGNHGGFRVVSFKRGGKAQPWNQK